MRFTGHLTELGEGDVGLVRDNPMRSIPAFKWVRGAMVL